ncbi:MAG: glycosyltransferase family 9 protein [Elusimicrobia bacterium]|nr:glycosyltransferase family 9 protein [Elusimicrobiota bacterium]
MKQILKGIEKKGRTAAAWAIGTAFPPRRATPAELLRGLQRGEIRKILLVRPYQGLGDLLCTTPVITNLKASCPGVSIHFLANTFNQAALQGNPGLDKVWAWDERTVRRPAAWRRMLSGLRRESFDLALVLSGNALSLTSILLAKFSGARYVAGYDTSAYGRDWGRWLFSCEIPYRGPVREIDKFLGLLEGMGLDCPSREPVYRVLPENASIVDQRLRELFPASGLPLLGMFIGGKTDRPERIWPPAYYAQAARGILERKACDLVVIAPPQAARPSHSREATFWLDEDIHLAEFKKAFGKDVPVFQEADLGRVAALLARLRLFICPDGGMMHVAAGLKVPALTLFFGTDPAVWNPPVPTAHFLRGPGPDPKSLEPAAVVAAALRLLDEKA